jgi:hypothetical protein
MKPGVRLSIEPNGVAASSRLDRVHATVGRELGGIAAVFFQGGEVVGR